METFNIIVQLNGIPRELLNLKLSPFDIVRTLGMQIISYESYPIADMIKMKVINIPKELPNYINIIS